MAGGAGHGRVGGLLADGRVVATDADLLGSILRVGTVVEIDAAGALHSGNYLVWSVRHRITAAALHTYTHILLYHNYAHRQNSVKTAGEVGCVDPKPLQIHKNTMKATKGESRIFLRRL